MSASSYHLLPVFSSDHGETARIALCDTLDQVIQAKADGCHIALLANDDTRTCHTEMEKLRLHCASTYGSGRFHSGMRCQQQKLFDVLAAAGFFTKPILIDRSATDDFRVHRDELIAQGRAEEPADFLALMTVSPTSILFNQLSEFHVRQGVRLEAFKTGEHDIAAFAEITAQEAQGVSSFSPLPGTLIILFNRDGYTPAHSAPALFKGADEQRPRMGFTGMLPQLAL